MIPKCKRCGSCCLDVGKTFFMHSKHPIFQAMGTLAADVISYDDEGPCAMFAKDEQGVGVCLIEKYLGLKWKPEVCRTYPNDDVSKGKCRKGLAE